jgi:hypothetical protein
MALTALELENLGALLGVSLWDLLGWLWRHIDRVIELGGNNKLKEQWYKTTGKEMYGRKKRN